jgi:glycosyltransferase involved in cell wall biosynthesis
MKPLAVSVIVPVYKVEKYLKKCIDSILANTFKDFELILVDDCSPDNCPAICDAYADQDNRIKVIHKTQNEGLPQARKTGFEHSAGKYIQFADSDDWIENTMLEKLLSAAVETDADIVSCDFYNDTIHDYHYEIQTFDTENLSNNLGFVHCCAVWNKLFRREILSLIEFPKYGKYEDRVITQQALYFSKKIVKIPYPLYHYFYNPESMSREISIKMYSEWRNNMLLVINFLRNNLGENFILKKDNINMYVNNFKYNVLRDKELRQDKSLLNFYPESKFGIYLSKKILKIIYKLIIPELFQIIIRKIKRRILK